MNPCSIGATTTSGREPCSSWAGVALVRVTLVALVGLLVWFAVPRRGPALRGAVLLATLIGLLAVPALAVVALGTYLVTLDSSIVNIALRGIMDDPAAPWWPAGMAVAVGVVWAGLAVWQRSEGWALAAGGELRGGAVQRAQQPVGAVGLGVEVGAAGGERLARAAEQQLQPVAGLRIEDGEHLVDGHRCQRVRRRDLTAGGHHPAGVGARRYRSAGIRQVSGTRPRVSMTAEHRGAGGRTSAPAIACSG